MSLGNGPRRLAAVALLAVGTAGCAAKLGAPQANIAAIETLRQQSLPAMNVGAFARGPGLSASDDGSVVIRAINVFSPPGGTFSGYLKATLEADLRSVGRLDPNAPYTLEGRLDARDVDSTVGTGSAALSAHFSLLKDGKPIFEKDLSVRRAWDSSFLGVEAIPDAINNFTSLYGELSVKLLTDPDFKAAAATK